MGHRKHQSATFFFLNTPIIRSREHSLAVESWLQGLVGFLPLFGDDHTVFIRVGVRTECRPVSGKDILGLFVGLFYPGTMRFSIVVHVEGLMMSVLDKMKLDHLVQELIMVTFIQISPSQHQRRFGIIWEHSPQHYISSKGFEMVMNTFRETLLILMMPFSYVVINVVEIKPGLLSPSDMPPIPMLW